MSGFQNIRILKTSGFQNLGIFKIRLQARARARPLTSSSELARKRARSHHFSSSRASAPAHIRFRARAQARSLTSGFEHARKRARSLQELNRKIWGSIRDTGPASNRSGIRKSGIVSKQQKGHNCAVRRPSIPGALPQFDTKKDRG